MGKIPWYRKSCRCVFHWPLQSIDAIIHKLLIAKLHAYGFDTDALKFIYSFFKGRKQRTKVNSSYISFAEILFGVPWGSILGPLLY